MQINHNDNKGNRLVISIFFQKSNDYSVLLGQIGFDKSSLRQMIPFKQDIIRENIDLSKYISNQKDFLYYNGLESAPPCTASTDYIILTDFYKMSNDQLSNYPVLMLNKTREIQPRLNRKIFISFNTSLLTKKRDQMKKKLSKIKSTQTSKQNLDKITSKIEKKDIIVNKKTGKNSKNKTKIANNTNSTMSNKTSNFMKKKNNSSRIENSKANNKTKMNIMISDEFSSKTQTNSNLTNSSNETNSTIEIFTDPCVEIVPFSVIKNKANSLSKLKKFNQPYILSSPSNKSNETMIIEFDLPKSNAEIMSMNLEAKQKYLQHLYKKAVLSPGDPFIFIQIKKLEISINHEDEQKNYSSFYVMDEMIIEGDDSKINEFIQFKPTQVNKSKTSNTTNLSKSTNSTYTTKVSPSIIEKDNKETVEINREMSNLEKTKFKKEDTNSRQFKDLENTLDSIKGIIDFQKTKIKSVNDQIHFQRLSYNEEIKNLIKNNFDKTEKLRKLREDILNDKVDYSSSKTNQNSFLNQTIINLGSSIENKAKALKNVLSKRHNDSDPNCKVVNVTHKQLVNSYNTVKIIDKSVFTLIKLVIIRLYKEFKNLDRISEMDCDNLLINRQGYIRISHSNLASIVKKAFSLEKKQYLSFSAKLQTLYQSSKKTLLDQNQNLIKQPENDVTEISLNDINQVLSSILQSNIMNKSQFNPTDSDKLKNLILEMIKNLPITLITKSLNKKAFLGASEKDLSIKPNSSLIIEKQNIETKRLNKFLKEKEKRQLNEIMPIGEGRRPMNKKGVEDQTEISDITNWPDQCKYMVIYR